MINGKINAYFNKMIKNNTKKSNKKNFLTGMKIGVDLDDVLSESIPALLKFRNNMWNTDMKSGDFATYDLQKILGVPAEETEKVIKKFVTSYYGKGITPMSDAKEVLDKLKKNNEFYVITARSNDIKEETETWINNYFPNIFSKIYFTNQSLKIGTGGTKGEICDIVGIDIFIEDNLDYVSECAGQNRIVYLMDRPWNQTDKLPDGVKRVFSWAEIGKLI